MSGSPKYTSYALSYDHEAALAAERARQAAIEQARRAAEEERRRQERVAKAKARAGHVAAKLRNRLSSVGSGELASFVVKDVARLAERLKAKERKVRESDDLGDVAQFHADADRIATELNRVEAKARAAKLSAELDAEARDAAEIAALLGTLDTRLSERFDRAGAQHSRALVTQLNAAVKGRDLAKAQRLSLDARQQVERHLDATQRRHEDWQGRRDRALDSIASAADRVAAAQADEVCARWVGADLAALGAGVRLLERRVEGDRPEDVQGDCDTAVAALDGLAALAQKLQLDDERRQAMVKGLISVMDRMSFTLQKGYPANDDQSDATSIVRIRVRRGADRSSIDIGIGIDGGVVYDIDGFARRLERASDGEEAATCDEAEEQIQAFHRMLEKEFGVQTEELRWVGHNPNRILRTAKQAPSSNPVRRTV